MEIVWIGSARSKKTNSQDSAEDGRMKDEQWQMNEWTAETMEAERDLEPVSDQMTLVEMAVTRLSNCPIHPAPTCVSACGL